MRSLQPTVRLAQIIRADEAVAWRDGYAFRAAAEADAARLRQEALDTFRAESRRGFETGREAGAQEAALLLQAAERLISETLAGLEQDLVLLAVDLAERILGEVPDRAAILQSARHALSDLRGDDSGVFYVAPHHLREFARDLAAAAGERAADIAVEADPAAGPRDCSLMTARGIMRLGVEAQLTALRAGILRWYQGRTAQ